MNNREIARVAEALVMAFLHGRELSVIKRLDLSAEVRTSLECLGEVCRDIRHRLIQSQEERALDFIEALAWADWRQSAVEAIQVAIADVAAAGGHLTVRGLSGSDALEITVSQQR